MDFGKARGFLYNPLWVIFGPSVAWPLFNFTVVIPMMGWSFFPDGDAGLVLQFLYVYIPVFGPILAWVMLTGE